MADWEWTKKETNKAIAALSTLKRAIGIANHATKIDEFEDFQRNRLHIYTPDQESAELIGELLYRYGSGNRAAYYNAHPELSPIRKTIRLKALPEGGFDTSIAILHPRHFAERILKMAAKHIAPDKHFTR